MITIPNLTVKAFHISLIISRNVQQKVSKLYLNPPFFDFLKLIVEKKMLWKYA